MPTDANAVPEVVQRYQDAHDRHDTEAALAAFTPDAVVHDDGRTYVGTDEVRRFLTGAAAEFTFTRTSLGAAPDGEGSWVVANHLEGDFPGGQVDLRYRFRLEGGRIAELTIAP